MKILFTLIHGDYKSSGGSNIAATNLISFLLTKGVEVHAIVRNEGDFKNWMTHNGVYVYVAPHLAFFAIPSINNIYDFFLYPIRVLRNLLYYYPAINDVHKIIKKIKPDIVHSNNSIFSYGYIPAKKENIPHIWHLREYAGCFGQLKPFPSLNSLKRKLRNSYTISVTEDIASYFDCKNSAKDRVIYDSVNNKVGDFCSNKENYFLVVGTITEQKGILDLILGFSKYAKESNKNDLWIVGTGKSYFLSSLQVLVSKLGLNDRVKFLGYRKDVTMLMSKAQALIVSSWVESFGLVTVEAMMCGCLVVGKNVYGTKVLMNNCKGCELPYQTEKELIYNLLEIDRNGIDFYKERLLIAQKTANRLYTSDINNNKVYDFYFEIINKISK